MRLLTTLSSDLDPSLFSSFLKSKGIDNEIEATTGGFRLWIYDEDQVEQASQLFDKYKKNPSDGIYSETVTSFSAKSEEKEEGQRSAPSSRRRSTFSNAPYGKISLFIIFSTVLLFFWAIMGRQNLAPPGIPGVSQAPILAPIDQRLLYDYPLYFQLRDQLLKIFTPKDIEANIPPSPEAQSLIERIQRTPYWTGIYERIVLHFRNSDFPLKYSGPMFEKIRQGEIWRVFTPALLHFNLLHIFFNLLWFIMLGNQIEWRLGSWRYVLLLLITGIASNTAQYLMSGSFFMGLSGIVCALAGFILARQQKAPWEGYLLHRTTMIFLGVFVFGIFLLQLIFFGMQLWGRSSVTIPIANTAHLTGALVGYVLGRLPFFSLNHRHKK